MDDKTFDAQTAQDWIVAIERPGRSSRDDDIYPILSQWLADNKAASVLDIGCGQGICAEKVVMPSVQYVGLDPLPLLVARAQELYTGDSRRFVTGNAYDLPFANESFDAAFSVLVWHLLEDLPRAAAEMARVLKAGGAALCITANPEAMADWQAMYDSPRVDGKRLEGVMDMGGGLTSRDVLYFHTRDEIATALASAGLTLEGVTPFRASKRGTGAPLLMSLRASKAVVTDAR